MFLLALLAFMPKLILGFSIAQLIWSDERLTSLLLKLFLSIPLGMGTASILLFFWKWAGLDHQGYIVVELVVTALFFIGMIFARKDAFRNIEFDVELSQIKQNKLILLVVALAAVVSSAVFISTALALPHGREDAWSNWNLVARFLYYSNDLSRPLEYIAVSSFPGYPFMLGLNVANGWIFVNAVTTRVPIVLAGLFAFSIAGILFFGLLKMRGIQLASIAVILVLSPWLAQSAAGLYSDVPLAVYYLSAAVLISLYWDTEVPALASLAGLVTGFTGWIKNDGIPFTVIITALVVVMSIRKKEFSASIRFVLGLAAPLIIVIVYHAFLAAPGNIVTAGTDTWLRLQDLGRIQIVASFFARETLLSFGAPAFGYNVILLAILLMGGIDFKAQNSLAIAFLFLAQYAVYFGVYLITPLPLEWHLSSSMPRVLLHLVPLLTFSVFRLLKVDEIFPMPQNRVGQPLDT